MDEVDRAIATLKPDSCKGYTVGDNTHKELATYPWRMDDEKLVYPFYEKIAKAGYDIVCVHKGLYPPSVEQQFPQLTPMRRSTMSARRPRTGRRSASSSTTRPIAGPAAGASRALRQFEKTGRVEWTSDLAEIPAKYGVSNVYGDLGQVFAKTAVVEPRLCAALMGMLIKGMGADHVVWGTDALWTGAPQWQIEGLRRLEIPEDMRKKHGFAELGPADGPVKQAIFGEQLGAHVPLRRQEGGMARRSLRPIKQDYERRGRDPSNLRYGYVVPG